ncbi:hypothetical protein DITRI_Ditri08aG0023000 [Diplodiscus trichospermus]
MIFCEPVQEQILNVRNVLRCFQAISGLKRNFQKSNIFGIDIDGSDLEFWASRVGYSVGIFPTLYLGLPLGGGADSISIWWPIIVKFEKRLAGWKSINLIKGSRVTMIRAVILHTRNYGEGVESHLESFLMGKS